jgi:transposase
LILQALAPFLATLKALAVESTYNWYWLVDGLMDAGVDVRLVNTAAVPQYAGLKHGNDQTDARHLAHLLRLGILPEGYVYPRELRGVRDLLRRRFLLVRQSVTLSNSLQCHWARRTGHGIRTNDVRTLSAEMIETTFANVHERLGVLSELKLLQCLHTQIDQIERWVMEAIRGTPASLALRSVPGIGAVLSSTILLETGEISRFDSVGDYASYCRMVDSARLSNNKKKGQGNRKCGNRYLCWAWIEAANFAIRYSPEIRRWYDRKAGKKRRLVAIKAVAHKLARAGYYLIKDGGHFDMKRAFG